MPLAHFKVFYKNRKKISMNVSPFLPVITQACPPCIKYLAMRGKHAHCHTNTTPCSFIRSLTLFPQIRLPTLPPFLFRSCHVQLTSRAVRGSRATPTASVGRFLRRDVTTVDRHIGIRLDAWREEVSSCGTSGPALSH